MQLRWTLDVVSADCVCGWAIAPAGIHDIRVYLRGRQIGSAHLDVPRPDVAAAHPDVPKDTAERSGFYFKMPVDGGSWTQPEVRLVLVENDGAAHEIYHGTIISPGDVVPDISVRSPFPKEVCQLLAAIDARFATHDWTDELAGVAVDSIVRLVAHGSKEVRGLYPWLRYLKAMWTSFEFVQTHFPRFGEEDPFRKDAAWAASNHVELFAIASHLYVLRSHGLPGNFLEFGSFKGFSASLLSLACRELSIKMEVFDSFQGLPASTSDYLHEGEFAGSLDEVRRHVSQFGAPDVVEFHPGFFEDTVTGVRDAPLCIWMDVDLASSSRDVMQWLRLLPSASCVFSHECTADNFGPDGIRYRSGPDDVIGPIVAAFRDTHGIPIGRFIAGNTGAFWERDHGLPILPVDPLLRLIGRLA